FSFYFVFEKISNKEILSKAQSIKKEILPGGNKAVLTLSDGSKINLDSTVNGEVAAQSGINIYKTNDGQLIYKIVSSSEPENKRELLYNTISTPNGGQYQINLPDGTRVWLNAASSLRYPIGFNDKERTIQLTGEAYFEVAKIIMPDGSLKPFKVISENQTVEVLGTHFNINAYTDEPFVRTTLLEGKVSVSTSLHDQKILSPGQQSVVKDQIDVKNVDAREEVAWKNGLFRFNSQNIASIMRQIARWYDVEVIYKGNITEETFSGSISKYANVTEVLQMLELTGFVHFIIEESSTDTERRVIVM
ncbi:MAG TPA: FecR family protein, partial [Pelobium sp.]|nr:FecR family protein [Pelobium sp.]